MSHDDVLKIVASIIAGFGGFGAVIVLVIKFSANMIANRLAEKYSLKMNKELMTYMERISLDDNCIESKFTEQQVHELKEKICEKIFEFRNLLAYSGAFIPHFPANLL